MPRSPEQRRRDDERGYVIGQIANGRSISNLHSTIDEIVAAELRTLRGAEAKARLAQADLEIAHDALRELVEAVGPGEWPGVPKLTAAVDRAHQILGTTQPPDSGGAS